MSTFSADPRRMHVFADIKPYICTFSTCADILTTFPSRELWTEHEFSVHRVAVSFSCYLCSQALSSENEVFNHLHTKHSVEIYLPSERHVAISKSKLTQAQPVGVQECPLCHKTGLQTQRAFGKHLGRHMEQIALLALPPEEDSGSELDDDDYSSTQDDRDRLLANDHEMLTSARNIDKNVQEATMSRTRRCSLSGVETSLLPEVPVTDTSVDRQLKSKRGERVHTCPHPGCDKVICL